jgi:arylsulfatase
MKPKENKTMKPKSISIIATNLLTALVVALICTTTFALPAVSAAAAESARRPNIVMIVADDLGFSDPGMFGGEIKTPNLDELAKRGVRFTDFHTASSCSPTRSMLFSGTDMHIAGVGNMDEMTAPNQKGKPGYEGNMNHAVVSFVELLRDNGYHTYMAGKWHLGKQPDLIPAARGFERDFTLLDGAGSYFDMTNLSARGHTSVFTEDGKYLTNLPKDYYATKTYIDKMIGYIESNRKDGKPFFAYVAHQAPHDPYGLPNDWLRKYKGKYDIGWDTLRKQRLARMKELGIMPTNATLADRHWYVPTWEDLAPASRVVVTRKMEIYASLVENMDYHTGRLIDYLKKIGEYDNTLFIFFSDNGAEGNDLGGIIAGTPGTPDFLFYAQKWSNTHPNSWGRPGSHLTYGPGWAQVSATPFRDFKVFTAEGGNRTPLIISGVGVQRQAGGINQSLLSVMDLAPTILEITGISHPSTYKGQPIAPIQGKSLMPLLAGKTDAVRGPSDWLGFESIGNRAIRQGDWKLLWEWKPFGKGEWELFNVAQDPGEENDLSAQEPEKVKQLLALWDEYVKTNNIILPNRNLLEGMEEKLPPRTPVDESWPPLKFKKQFIPPQASTATEKEKSNR